MLGVLPAMSPEGCWRVGGGVSWDRATVGPRLRYADASAAAASSAFHCAAMRIADDDVNRSAPAA